MGFLVLTASGAIKTGTVPTNDLAAATGTLVVAHGGTGDTTLTNHGVMIGQATAAVAVTAAGTTGQVLTGVTNSDPVWAAPAASGALVLLEQHTASASASLDFTTGITSTYDSYVIQLIDILPASAAQSLQFRVSTDGGATYDATGAYYGALDINPNTGASGVTQTNAATAAVVFPGVDNTASSGGVSGEVRLFNPLSAAIRKHMTVAVLGSRAADVASCTGIMLWNTITAVNAFRFLFASGNITSGIIRLYGVAKT